MSSSNTLRLGATVCSIVLVSLAVEACHTPPDIRRFCQAKCSCGCDVDACVSEETALRDSYRVDEKCSRIVDEYTTCQIENGYCEKTRSGSITFPTPACSELFSYYFDCQRKAEAKRNTAPQTAPAAIPGTGSTTAGRLPVP
ncbi:MAG: hypothetical protein U0441_11115 [Polyangiaceae bacterium]